jgi:K(+)-stimulated pyrophosphate-energized sodium pump
MDVAETLVYLAPLAGGLALLFAAWRAVWVVRQDAGTAAMRGIAGRIREGTSAFFWAESRYVAVFLFFVAAALALVSLLDRSSAWMVSSFAAGGLGSVLVGWLGMRASTSASVRAAQAASSDLGKALKVAFAGGSVLGAGAVGLGLLGLAALWLVYTRLVFVEGTLFSRASLAIDVITGFALGASAIALFARVGGGIFTSAADTSAASKIDGLDAHAAHHPAKIADRVGEHVGAAFGAGADLFESFAGAVVAAMVLGVGFAASEGGHVGPMILPLVLAGAGVSCSILGTFLVRTREGGNVQAAIDRGVLFAALAMAASAFALAYYVWPERGTAGVEWIDVGAATFIGLAVGVGVALVGSFFATHREAVLGTAIPIVLIAGGVSGAAYFAGLYGIALAALGMSSTTGIRLAAGAYRPIADDAGHIATEGGQGDEAKARAGKLDVAPAHGFAIACAALTALALFAAFTQRADLDAIDLLRPTVLACILAGAVMPFLFWALAARAATEAGNDLLDEVRRQLREVKDLADGNAQPDAARCVDVSTRAALRRLMLPGAMSIATPIVIGFAVGAEALGGLVVGVIVSGAVLGIAMANRSAKSIAPSLNILVKLVAIVALVIAPMI